MNMALFKGTRVMLLAYGSLLTTVHVGLLIALVHHRWIQPHQLYQATESEGNSSSIQVSSRDFLEDRSIGPSITWRDIFPLVNLSKIEEKWRSPVEFLQQMGSLSSREMTDALRKSELHGKDTPELFTNYSLSSDELDKPLSVLAGNNRIAPLVRNHAFKLHVGFRTTSTYEALASHVCDIFQDTHLWFFGDSNMYRMSDWPGLGRFGCQNISLTRKEKDRFYYEDAFRDSFERNLPSFNEKDHLLILANFDSLHALSLFPCREFKRVHDNRTLFEAWPDLVRYQLNLIRELPLQLKKYLVVFNCNSIDVQCFGSQYSKAIHSYMENATLYSQECSATWNQSSVDCSNSVLSDVGTNYLNNRLIQLPELVQSEAKMVDAYYTTKGMGYLSAPTDGRHYHPLLPLNLVQAMVNYMIARIESFAQDAMTES